MMRFVGTSFVFLAVVLASIGLTSLVIVGTTMFSAGARRKFLRLPGDAQWAVLLSAFFSLLGVAGVLLYEALDLGASGFLF